MSRGRRVWRPRRPTASRATPPWVVLALMCAVVAMTVVDLSVVNVALPSIQAEFGARAEDLQWVVVSYAVVLAGFLLLGGRVGDLLGHRTVLVCGLGALTAASLLGGLAGSLEVLVAARAGQGLGAALAAPNALAVLSHTFPEGPLRARAIGVLGAAAGSAAVIGSVLGGLLVQVAGWSWVFFVNVPAGVGLTVLVLALVPAAGPSSRRARADVTGALLLTGGLMATVLGVHHVGGREFSVATLLLVLIGPALLAGFLLHENRTAAPLIPLATLRRRSLLAANATAALLSASFLSLIYHATLFVQQVLQYPPLEAGASTIPIAVVCLLVSVRLAPAAIERLGPARTAGAGAVLLATGTLLLTRAPVDATYARHLLPAYCLIGAGLALGQVAAQVAALAGAAHDEAGLAGGALETAREAGGALGLGVLTSLVISMTAGPVDAFHVAVAGSALLAAASASVAFLLLHPAQGRSNATATSDT